jgi:hypothetical protein
LKGLGEVAEKMKTIRHLQCIWGTFPRTFSVSSGAVAADDFNSGMSLEPFLQTLRLSIREKIDRLVVFQVHQDRSVALPLFPRPVIHPEDLDLGAANGARTPLQHPQNRVRAGVEAEFRGEMESGFATESVTDPLQCLAMAIRLATIRHGKVWEPLSEDFAPTVS